MEVDSGTAHVYQRIGDQWELVTDILADDGVTNTGFGFSIAIDDSTMVVDGAAYIFQPNPCPADLNGDGQFTILDFLAFQNAFDAGCP